jgi:hypothetical protein
VPLIEITWELDKHYFLQEEKYMDISEWLPMPPNEGPPLPKIFNIYWPWYKSAAETHNVDLNAGHNPITYHGKAQTWGDVKSSISAYLTGISYWEFDVNGILGWSVLYDDTPLVDGLPLSINVSQACTWTYTGWNSGGLGDFMSEEYARLQRALAQHTTPEGRKVAAQAMREYLAAEGSNASLASFGLNETYPNIMSLNSLPDRIENDSEFAKLMHSVINNVY